MDKALKRYLTRLTSFLVTATMLATVGFGGAMYAARAIAADRVITLESGAIVTLTQKQCKNKTILEIAKEVGVKEELKKKLKQGSVEFQGEKWELCYVEDKAIGDAAIGVVDERGYAGVVPLPVK